MQENGIAGYSQLDQNLLLNNRNGAKHDIAHLPYDPSCEICVQCRRANVPHQLSTSDSREIPLVVGDYGFIRDSMDQDMVTTLVLKVYPFNIFFACVVAAKGPDPLVVARLAHFIKETGLTHFAYRSDREPAIMAMIQEACVKTGHNGLPVKGDDENPRARRSCSW